MTLGYEDFICAAKTQMQEKLGEGAQIQLHQMMKNNSVLLDALSVSEHGSSIAPTIYLNDFYEEYLKGVPLPDLVGKMAEIYRNSRLPGPFDTSFYLDYEKVSGRLACKLINRQKNRELLKQVPHRPFLNLEIVVYYCFSDEQLGNGTILVYKNHLETWKISEEELFDRARANTLQLQPVEFVNMHQILERYCGRPSDEAPEKAGGESAGKEANAGQNDEHPMYVLTNQSNYFGAAGILFDSVLQQIAAEVREDFWVLPSSIHECIIVPCSLPMARKDLKEMVKEINRCEVAEEDYLSDDVYCYHCDIHKLSL